MSEETLQYPPVSRVPEIPIHRIEARDVWSALAAGYADFLAKPSHLIFLSVIYPIAGILIAAAAVGNNLLPLLFPLVAGFAILGPVAAVATYEVSRRRERGADTSWSDLARLPHAPAVRQIAEMAAILLAIFVAWLATAHAIYVMALGSAMPASAGEFARNVLTTSGGWTLILVGNFVGFAFAAVAFTISVVSFPLLLDREVGLGTALATSVRCVAANPAALATWGAIVATSLVVGTAALFVGLAIVLPVLGHASWHLYRKLVP